MSNSLAILFVEDSEDDVILLVRELKQKNYQVDFARVQDPESLREVLRQRDWQIVISDYSMPQFNGVDALHIVRESKPLLPFILISGTVGEEIAVESIKAGANDYLMKQNLIRFVPAVERAIREAQEAQLRQKAQEELRENQAILSLIYHHTSDLLVLYRMAEDSLFRLVSVNVPFLSFLESMGIPRSPKDLIHQSIDVVAQQFWAVGTPEEKIHSELIRESLIKEKVTPTFLEVEYSPHKRFLEVSIVPVNANGQRFLLWAGRDVTERKLAEERQRNLEVRLAQAQKMEALGRLAAGIAHDFRNILTGIIGFGELIRTSEHQDGKMVEFAELILQAANRGKELVRQILTFSGRQPPSRQPMQLENIIQEAVAFLRPLIPPQVMLEVLLPPNPIPILADASQMHQVVMNLCTNAIQSMNPTGGQIIISLSPLFIEQTFASLHPPLKEGNYICLAIADSGSGIAPDVLERLFEPFFTTKPQGVGTGLGLAVVHGIIQSHEGAILVESELGKGTTFRVYLPAVKTEVREREWKAYRGNGETIMYVDDDKSLAHLCGSLLTQLGYQAVISNDPIEALGLFQESPQRFTLVITDLSMPQMSGPELAIAMRKIRDDIPMILVTGFSGEVDEHSLPSMGFRSILIKPYFIRSVGESVRRALMK